MLDILNCFAVPDLEQPLLFSQLVNQLICFGYYCFIGLKILRLKLFAISYLLTNLVLALEVLLVLLGVRLGCGNYANFLVSLLQLSIIGHDLAVVAEKIACQQEKSRSVFDFLSETIDTKLKTRYLLIYGLNVGFSILDHVLGRHKKLLSILVGKTGDLAEFLVVIRQTFSRLAVVSNGYFAFQEGFAMFVQPFNNLNI
jgi:hypothetical protein